MDALELQAPSRDRLGSDRREKIKPPPHGYRKLTQKRTGEEPYLHLRKRSATAPVRQGRTVASTDFNGKISTAAYEPFCGGFATTSARGVRRRASFDTLCRLTQVEVGTPDSDPLEVATPSESREFEYDDLGRLIKTVQSTSAPSTYGVAFFGVGTYGSGASQSEERSYEYDSLDRLTKITFEDGKTMEYEYDEEGNVTKITENASSSTPKVTEFSYYGDNRLHQIIYVRSGGNQVFTYDYDDGGRPLTLIYPASTGIVAHFDGPLGEEGWDGNGQLRFLRYVKSGTTVIRRFEYQYDDSGNRISQLDVTPTKATKWEYGYDWLDRLESVKKAEAATVGALGALQLVSVYQYDAADNRIEFQVPNLNPALTETFTYSYKDGDDIESISKMVGSGSPVVIETFTSDDDGNLLTRTDTATSVVTSYTWDDFNRLTAVSATDASKNQTHTFGVNGFRRKKKDKNDVETTEYAAGLETAVAKNSTETITYLTGGGGIMGFERSSDGEMFWFITDALTTVRDVVNSSGTVVASYEFSEYGQRIASSESGVSSQKTFVGGMSVQDEVADTGLMLMGHRFYDAGLGRFLSRDPIGFSGGLNLYEYASSSPASMTDYTGLQPGGGDKHAVFTGDYGMDPGAYTIVNGPMPSRWQSPPSADDISLLSPYDEMNLLNLAKSLGLGEKTVLAGGSVLAILALLNSFKGGSGRGGFRRRNQRGTLNLGGPCSGDSRRNPNKLEPLNEALGPHSVSRSGPDGRITNYEVYDINPHTGEFVPVKRFRGVGKAHGGVNTPFIVEPIPGKGVGAPPKISRPPLPWELPKGY